MDGVPALQTRLQLKESYIYLVGLTTYVLPYGPYYPEGQDERGIYYRAPIPIIKRGLFNRETLLDGGVYVPTDVTWSVGLVWLYVRNDDGSIWTEAFNLRYGDHFVRETFGGPPPSTSLHATVSFSADGKPQGPFELRDSAGTVAVKGEFKDGHRTGLWAFWDSGGAKVLEVTYRLGLRDGPCRMWYGSSFPESAGKDKLAGTFAANQWHGEKTSWWADRTTRCTTLFDHGAIRIVRCWGESGDEVSQQEALSMASDESKADDKLFKALDEKVDRSLRSCSLRHCG